MPAMRALALPLLLTLPLTACSSGTEPAALRVELAADLSGTVHVRGISSPASTAGEEGSSGVTWNDRAALSAAAGRFDDVSALEVCGLTFGATRNEGIVQLTVTIPRGPDAPWIAALAPLTTDAERRAKGATLAPEGGMRRPGHTVEFRIELPADVLSHGYGPRGGGIDEDAERSTATLVVPVDDARATRDEVVWSLSWLE